MPVPSSILAPQDATLAGMHAHPLQPLAHMVCAALKAIAQPAQTSAPSLEEVLESLHRPKQADHGDWATGICLRLAKPWGQKPQAIAQALQSALAEASRGSALLESAEVAGPGFLNFRLSVAARTAVVLDVLRSEGRFGHQPEDSAGAVLLEYVSANPTGPLHVGHGRQAALGDSLARVMASQGFRVHREFYYNDAGAQIENLARSVQARLKGWSPEHPQFPEDGYRGDYILDIARAYQDKHTVQARDGEPIVGSGDPEDLQAIRRFAVAFLRHEQDLDLQAFGVEFDRFALESALYEHGRVAAVVERLTQQGATYEQDGALWLRTTEHGDDKDRVMRKSDGGFTYFVPDVAYHWDKYQRGFTAAINIQGSDHHGTVARVRAGLQMLQVGISAGYPDYILHKMVTVMRGGQEVKLSKRAGSYVTLRDLIRWSGGANDLDPDQPWDEQRGRDAVRFFLVSRKPDSEFVFDLDLALAQSDENPVYYVQYAHARACSVLGQAGQSLKTCEQLVAQSPEQAHAAQIRLSAPRESLLCQRLSAYAEVLAQAAEDHAPHLVAFYLRDLASDFHSFYNAERVLVDDPDLRQGRLLLVAATASVLAQGLARLGVSAPERM
ncbi:MAG: Arginine--tRNA ligase [Pseudomonadota bacterium]